MYWERFATQRSFPIPFRFEAPALRFPLRFLSSPTGPAADVDFAARPGFKGTDRPATGVHHATAVGFEVIAHGSAADVGDEDPPVSHRKDARWRCRKLPS